MSCKSRRDLKMNHNFYITIVSINLQSVLVAIVVRYHELYLLLAMSSLQEDQEPFLFPCSCKGGQAE